MSNMQTLFADPTQICTSFCPKHPAEAARPSGVSPASNGIDPANLLRWFLT